MCVAFRNVRAGYPQWEVDSGNLRLPTAGVALIAGANGAGKTGFFKGILGVEPAMTSGEIEFGGKIVKDLGTSELRGEVRDMSQERATFPDLTAGDAFAAAASERARHDTTLHEMVDRVGRKSRVMHLSSGNRAVLSLAQTLSSEPKLALLDEPFANVDPPNRVHLLKMIDYARRKFGTAFIIVEHGNIRIPGANYYTVSREDSRACILRKSD
jgi:ABC-type multidrug transport system ATPase subunit